MTFRLLYPQSRVVSLAWVLSHGFDAKVNSAVEAQVAAHGVFADGDGAYEALVASIPAPDLAESITLLEDLGLVTFARGARARAAVGGTVLITGRTYPVKDQLRALGGTWDARAKGWLVPDAVAVEAQALVTGAPASAPASRPASRARYGSRYTRFSSGAEVFTNVRGRCEDAPCCGCCS